MKKSIHILKILFSTSLLLLPACTHQSHIKKKDLHINFPITENSITKTQYSHPPITIFIHGTHLIRRTIFHSVFNNQTSLLPASNLDPQQSLYKRLFTLSHSDPERFPMETAYVFGWSGKLSSYERESAAKQLHEDLLLLINSYQKQYNAYPIMNIVAHSHGCNIALNLAKFDSASDTKIIIESLVLLACPVQEETMDYITNSMFNRIYAMYSSLDMVQILAPQVIRQTFFDAEGNKIIKKYRLPRLSSRQFPPHEHLLQTKIKVNGHAIFHTEFTSLNFFEILPFIITKLDRWYMEEHDHTGNLDTEKLLRIYKHHKHNYH